MAKPLISPADVRAPHQSIPRPAISPADEAAAGQLRDAIANMLRTARIGSTPEGKEPKLDPDTGLWRSPSGAPLAEVVIFTPAPDSADMPTTVALVDPRKDTGEFYATYVGGNQPPGAQHFLGPAKLPGNIAFTLAKYGDVQIEAIAAAANKPRVTPFDPASVLTQEKIDSSMVRMDAGFRWQSSGPERGHRVRVEVDVEGLFNNPGIAEVERFALYEEGNSTPVATFDGGVVREGFDLGGSAFDFPAGDVSLGKRYAVVAEIRTAGGELDRVRSGFFSRPNALAQT